MEFQPFGPEQAASGLPKPNTTAAFWRGVGVTLGVIVIAWFIAPYVLRKKERQSGNNAVPAAANPSEPSVSN